MNLTESTDNVFHVKCWLIFNVTQQHVSKVWTGLQRLENEVFLKIHTYKNI